MSPGITSGSTRPRPGFCFQACDSVGVRHDARDRVASDHDIDVLPGRRALHVDEFSGVDDEAVVGTAGVYFRSSERCARRQSRRRRCAACRHSDTGCDASRRPSWARAALSLVTRRGGPSGSPVGATGHTERTPRRSRPSSPVGRPRRSTSAAGVNRQQRRRATIYRVVVGEVRLSRTPVRRPA